jgi:Calcineurin-like phosphoesterase superfamily domain
VLGQINASEIDELRPLPRAITIPGLEIYFCHATPRSDREIVTPLTPPAVIADAFAGVTEPIVVCGHTHIQGRVANGSPAVINAGSVGLPHGGRAAQWVWIEDGRVSLRSTPYDAERAADRCRQTSFPRAEPFAAELLEPITEVDGSFQYFEERRTSDPLRGMEPP